MWPFKKKPVVSTIVEVKNPKQIDFEIPNEHVPEIIQLYDDVKSRKTIMAKFLLWKRIEEIIPAVKATPDTHWTIWFKTATNVVVSAKVEEQDVRE